MIEHIEAVDQDDMVRRSWRHQRKLENELSGVLQPVETIKSLSLLNILKPLKNIANRIVNKFMSRHPEVVRTNEQPSAEPIQLTQEPIVIQQEKSVHESEKPKKINEEMKINIRTPASPNTSRQISTSRTKGRINLGLVEKISDKPIWNFARTRNTNNESSNFLVQYSSELLDLKKRKRQKSKLRDILNSIQREISHKVKIHQPKSIPKFKDERPKMVQSIPMKKFKSDNQMVIYVPEHLLFPPDKPNPEKSVIQPIAEEESEAAERITPLQELQQQYVKIEASNHEVSQINEDDSLRKPVSNIDSEAAIPQLDKKGEEESRQQNFSSDMIDESEQANNESVSYNVSKTETLQDDKLNPFKCPTKPVQIDLFSQPSLSLFANTTTNNLFAFKPPTQNMFGAADPNQLSFSVPNPLFQAQQMSAPAFTMIPNNDNPFIQSTSSSGLFDMNDEKKKQTVRSSGSSRKKAPDRVG